MRRSTRARVHRGILLALVLVGSWLAGSAHWVTVPHRLCEFHGTIEHTSGPDVAPALAKAPVGPIYREGEGVHEECPLATYARTESFPLPEPSLQESLAPARTSATLFVRAEPLPQSALFLLAPSRSPPA